jgi:hypothetical protein
MPQHGSASSVELKPSGRYWKGSSLHTTNPLQDIRHAAPAGVEQRQEIHPLNHLRMRNLPLRVRSRSLAPCRPAISPIRFIARIRTRTLSPMPADRR